MDKQLQNLQNILEATVQRAEAEGIGFWFARDLQTHLGYARWENFQTAIKSAIKSAMESCGASGYAASDHFRDVTKMVAHGKSSHSMTAAQSENLNPIRANKTGLMQQIFSHRKVIQ